MLLCRVKGLGLGFQKTVSVLFKAWGFRIVVTSLIFT